MMTVPPLHTGDAHASPSPFPIAHAIAAAFLRPTTRYRLVPLRQVSILRRSVARRKNGVVLEQRQRTGSAASQTWASTGRVAPAPTAMCVPAWCPCLLRFARRGHSRNLVNLFWLSSLVDVILKLAGLVDNSPKVQKCVQILQDKQDLVETQNDLVKLQIAYEDPAQKSEGKIPHVPSSRLSGGKGGRHLLGAPDALRCPTPLHAYCHGRRGAGDLRRIRDDNGDPEGRSRTRVRTLMHTDRRGSVPPRAGGDSGGGEQAGWWGAYRPRRRVERWTG
ncbi:hypothetical protein ZWY2020_014828 [Hordeum vulgare]|nr:hypothetical protein ZWY2020_014828 [Hordeum vulgare]